MRQFRPIGLVAQIVGRRLGAGDDQGIDMGGLQETGIVIETVHAGAGLFAAFDAAQVEQAQPHIQRAGSVFQQARELKLGGAHRRVRHVVDQPDMHRGAIVVPAQQELFDPAHSAALSDARQARSAWSRSAMMSS